MKIKIIIIFSIIAFLLSSLSAQDETDPILEFYSKRAGETFKSRDPLNGGISFSYTIRTYCKNIEKKGYARLTDSAISNYYYSFGELDSTITVVKSERDHDAVNITVPDIFSADYSFFFYPNDTGGTNMSIGFDTWQLTDSIPVGFAVIDRTLYYLKWLYLFKMHERKDMRYSRWLRFVEHEGYIFPDSIWELKAVRGILSTDYYRLETGITDFKIYR